MYLHTNRWIIIYLIPAVFVTLLGQEQCLSKEPPGEIRLNNKGVAALNKRKWNKAARIFKSALRINPNYFIARKNLAIAYSNIALASQSKPTKSVEYFHKAIFIDPANETSVEKFDSVLREMNRNPESFKDRLELGNIAQKSDDLIGAFVEYKTAQCIKDDDFLKERIKKIVVEIQTCKRYSNLEKSILDDWEAVYTKEYGRKD